MSEFHCVPGVPCVKMERFAGVAHRWGEYISVGKLPAGYSLMLQLT